MSDGVGAVAGLVLDPKSDIGENKLASNKIENIFVGLNEQWGRGFTEVKEVDHLYSTFLYRKEAGKHGYEQSLSRVGLGRNQFSHLR